MEWDEFKELYQNDNLEPTVGEVKKWLSTKDDFYYQMITDPKEKNPYYKSVKYDTCSVQFELHFQEDFKACMHNYQLSWVAGDQKYGLNFAISTSVLMNVVDSMQVADLMINAYGTEMEKAGRPPGEIKCMVDFIRKIANTGKQNHYSSPTYQYMEIDDWQYKNHYATGGHVMSSKGIKGPGYEIGAGDFYADEYGNISGGGGWQVAGYTSDPFYDGPAYQNNYRQPEVDILPGVKEVAKHPVTGDKGTIEYIIINLNDSHMWTRDQIADWLETLDVDLTFKEKPAKIDKPGYYKGQKIEYKGSGKLGEKKMADVYKGTVSIDFKIDDMSSEAIKMLMGDPPAISKEDYLKQIGGDTV